MNHKVNKLIPIAIQAIKDSQMAQNGVVDKEFKGYISSMGASIMQTGLLATLAFYANDEGKKANSSDLLKAIYQVITGNRTDQKNDLIRWVIRSSLKDTVDPGKEEIEIDDLDMDKMYIKEQEISDALVALKLALRTYKIKE